MKNNVNFDNLVQQIEYTDHALQNNARLVINRHVTAMAWLTGYYIVEYEQHGSDRAQYGERLLQNLKKRLGNKKFSVTTLKIYRQFYMTYSQLFAPIAQFLKTNLAICQSVTDQFVMPILQEKQNSVLVDSGNLFNKLYFTHLVSLIPINDPLKRAFYETMAIKGTWSVRELQRQIDSNYYERNGWSKRPEELARMLQNNAEMATLAMDIKSPFVFEFLGLRAKNVVEESDLESALIDNLQEFILELGMRFCFEERQKSYLSMTDIIKQTWYSIIAY